MSSTTLNLAYLLSVVVVVVGNVSYCKPHTNNVAVLPSHVQVIYNMLLLSLFNPFCYYFKF